MHCVSLLVCTFSETQKIFIEDGLYTEVSL